MIISLILITVALTWLGIETNWLRIRLPADETIKEYDMRVLAEIESEWQVKESAYQAWLGKRYEPVLVYCAQRDYDKVDRRDKWMVAEDDLQKRRNGEMLYQRGSRV